MLITKICNFVQNVRNNRPPQLLHQPQCCYVRLINVLIVTGPKFSEPIANVTVPVGREVILACLVENLGAYKVIYYVYLFRALLLRSLTNLNLHP